MWTRYTLLHSLFAYTNLASSTKSHTHSQRLNYCTRAGAARYLSLTSTIITQAHASPVPLQLVFPRAIIIETILFCNKVTSGDNEAYIFARSRPITFHAAIRATSASAACYNRCMYAKVIAQLHKLFHETASCSS